MVDGKLSLIFTMRPRPKGRPRFTRQGHAYTDQQTREYEQQIRKLAQQQYTLPAPLSGPLRVTVQFYFQPPKSDPSREFHTTRPDVDNLLKAFLDALEGVVFENDSQFVQKTGWKGYSSTPYIMAHIEKIESPDPPLPES